MFYSKKWVPLSYLEVGFLIVSAITWMLIPFVKAMLHLEADHLPLPISFFWVGIGMAIASVCFHPMIGITFSFSNLFCKNFKETLIALASALSGLVALELYFYHLGKDSPYFFLWAPILTLALLLIFLNPQKKLIRIRLLVAFIGVSFAIFHIEHLNVSNLSTFFLVTFILSAKVHFTRGGNLFQIFVAMLFLKGLTGGVYSFLIWNPHIELELFSLIHLIGGGIAIGLAILFFLKSLQEVRSKKIFFLSFTPLLCGISFPKELFLGMLPYVLPMSMIAVAMISTRALLRQSSLT